MDTVAPKRDGCITHDHELTPEEFASWISASRLPLLEQGMKVEGGAID